MREEAEGREGCREGGVTCTLVERGRREPRTWLVTWEEEREEEEREEEEEEEREDDEEEERIEEERETTRPGGGRGLMT